MANRTSPNRELSKARLDRKTVDNFHGGDRGSLFSKMYASRSLNCTLTHGSVKHAISWDTSPEQLEYDPLLVMFAEGLIETVHPLYFVARTGFRELLAAPGAGPKAAAIVKKLTVPLRACLVSKVPEVYAAGMDGLVQLAAAIGPALNPHLKLIIGQLSKNMTKAKYRDRLTTVFNTLEQHCGDPCLKIIKAKVPVYCSINLGRRGDDLGLAIGGRS